jgi:ATP-dependent DNA helicase RecG
VLLNLKMAGSKILHKKNPESSEQTTPVYTELQYLKGIGPKRAAALRKAGIENPDDLNYFFPRKYLDRSNVVKLSEVQLNDYVTVIGKIESTGYNSWRRRFFYLVISDGTGILKAVWFNQVEIYRRMFTKYEWISLSGKIGYYQGYQMVHPDFDHLGEGDALQMIHTGRILPVYPGRDVLRQGGINSYSLRRIFYENSSILFDPIQEILPVTLVSKYRFVERRIALYNLHLPETDELLAQGISRFKYEEFFFPQLMLALQHYHYKKEEPGIAFKKGSPHLEELFHSLPFEMTAAQKRVMKEIRADMRRPHPMNRLLQGDVGSGKTLVALMTMLIALDNGYQAALMVPTEILAEQHYKNISVYLRNMPFQVSLLTGNTPQKERETITKALFQGEPFIIVGTHALIQESVTFTNLGLIVIDEQHRFGVMQRSSLQDKGILADVLVMTATPIPRTLALTIYGSLDVSILDELPSGRKPVRTAWRTDKKSDEIYTFVRDHVTGGEQAFIVFPLIEESEKMDLKAATESYQFLKSGVFKNISVSLLHGRMSSEEKEEAMKNFVSGRSKILVTTTVIEVGVDIPNASIMLIEHAERFGLSQLHQLRGRVGRGGEQSYCILKTPEKIGDVAKQRMEIMERTNDGFVIAEEDLNLRGWGEFFGVKQSGFPSFKIANPILDIDIMKKSREDAFELVSKDPHLRAAEHYSLREHFNKYFAPTFNLAKVG